jgi:hypothetical protein
MDKFQQDIIWLAQQMGIPPEVALKIAKEGGMNVPPQTGAAPMNFNVQDDRGLHTPGIPGVVDPSGMQPQPPGNPLDLMTAVKGMFSGMANPMQSTGMGSNIDPDFMKLFGKIKMLIGGM